VDLTADDLGYGNISTENVGIERIKLCHNSTREKIEGVSMGDFFTSSKNYGKTITFHVLSAKPQRLMFDSSFQLECRSFDMIKGTKYGTCGDCPHAQWKEDKGKSIKAECLPREVFLVVPSGESIPYEIGLNGVRTKAGVKIRKHLNFLAAENSMKPPEERLPIYFYKIKLSSVEISHGGFQGVQSVQFTPDGIEKDQSKQFILVNLYRQFRNYQGEHADAEE
jgi:hypothetical protein